MIKKKLLEQGENQFQKRSDKTVEDFIKQPDYREFYMNTIERLLVDYKPGDPEMKPDVLKQIAEIDKQRKQQMEEMQRNSNGQIAITQNGKQIPINI